MIREHWYVILRSEELRGRPVGLTRFGQRLVAWRDASARACLADDVRAYAIREAHGYLWCWWGEAGAADEPDLPPLPWHPELKGQVWRSGTFTSEWPVHWSRAVENQLDMAHLAFVHRATLGAGSAEALTVLTEVDDTRILATTAAQEGRFAIELRLPNTWLNCIGPRMMVQMAFVPVDATTTRQYKRIYQRFVTAPFVGEAVAEVMDLFHRVVLNQDRRVGVTQEPVESSLGMDETRLQADAAITAFRRWHHRHGAGGRPTAPDEQAPAVGQVAG